MRPGGLYGPRLVGRPPHLVMPTYMRSSRISPEHQAITVEQLEFLGARLPEFKAPGMDGRRYADMRKWSRTIWEWIALLLSVVERTGKWPQGLRNNEVMMLPKGDSGDALDLRPIVLLASLYRVWAAIRAQDLRAWMRLAGIRPLHGVLRDAEEHGLLAALL